MKSRLLHVATELGLFVLFCWITLTFLFGIRQMPDNSMYPKLMEHLGMSQEYLVDKLIEQAMENAART